ncbi:MAG: methionine/alanine import family NSS transporter small subunit [Ignavibacterium sp.]|jgi:uncharacterized protein involved in exopolysaccharide biosynthesis
MSIVTVITMVLTIGIVWGGFLMVLVTALRKERDKSVQ